MKKSFLCAAAALVLALAPSCQQMQTVGKETIPKTEVVLAKKNFRVIATQVTGEDKGFALFTGVSMFSKILGRALTWHPLIDKDIVLPTGLTIDPVSEAKALDNLYKNTGADRTGRATQLINVRKEFGGFNAIIFGRPSIRITGDLIEFCPTGYSSPIPDAAGATPPAATPVAAPAAAPAAAPKTPAPAKKKSRRRR